MNIVSWKTYHDMYLTSTALLEAFRQTNFLNELQVGILICGHMQLAKITDIVEETGARDRLKIILLPDNEEGILKAHAWAFICGKCSVYSRPL